MATLYQELLNDFINNVLSVYRESDTTYIVVLNSKNRYIVSIYYPDKIEIQQGSHSEVITNRKLIDKIYGQIKEKYVDYLDEFAREEILNEIPSRAEKLLKSIKEDYYKYLSLKYNQVIADELIDVLMRNLIQTMRDELIKDW